MKPALSAAERKHLRDLVQYLNLAEMKAWCREHDLPLYIEIERPDGRRRRTSDRDRKDVVLKRILDHALRGRRGRPTLYGREVVADGPLPAKLTSRTRIRYGQYEKKNPAFVQKMEELTGGRFRLGMIARLVLRDFWTAGTAPTLKQFAEAWVEASENHESPRPEGAYLVDLWRGEAGPDWKARRNRNAREALRLLADLNRRQPR